MILSSLHSFRELILCIYIVFLNLTETSSFTISSHSSITAFKKAINHQTNHIPKLYVQNSDTIENDDAKLLQLVSKEMLQQLCQQYNISSHGTKPQLLLSLRNFAEKQIQDERIRRKDRIRRIEKGSDDGDDEVKASGKAKHTILDIPDDNDVSENYEDELEGVFYFSAPINLSNTTTNILHPTLIDTNHLQGSMIPNRPKNKIMSMKSSASVTAPPFHPDIQPNEKGERSITVYSTTDQNDLTSVASHLSPSAPDMMKSETLQSSTSNNPLMEGSKRKKEIEKESETAEGILTDLVRN